MANTIGVVEYAVKLSTTDLKKGVTEAKAEISQLGTNADKTGNSLTALKKVGKVAGLAIAAGTAVAIKATGDLISDTIGAYKEYQQLEGGVKKIFGDTMPTVMDNAQKAFQTAQISANEYMSQVTSFSASLLQATAGNAEEAAKIADTAIIDMADNVNTFGSSMESVQSAFQGFAKQQYSLLDNLKLGYGGTKTEMERLLADAEKISGIHYDISNLGDVYSAIHVIQEELKITGTSGQEALTTIEGSANMVKSAFENIKAALGSGDKNFLVKSIDGFITGIKSLIKNITAILPNILEGMAQITAGLIEQLPAMVQELLPPLIEGITALALAIVENLPAILQIFVDNIDLIVEALVNIIFALIPQLPQILILLVEAIINAIIAIIGSLAKNVTKAFTDMFVGIGEFFQGLLANFGDFADGAIKAFTQFANSIGDGLNNIGKWFRDVFQGVYDFVTGVFRNIGDFFAGIWDGIKTMFTQVAVTIGDAVSGAFKSIVNAVLGFVEGIVNGVVNTINIFADGINWILGAVSGGNASIGRLDQVHFGRLATGGIVEAKRGGQLILAGEGGEDEWVVPESKMADMIQKLTSSQSTAGVGVVNINVDGIWATDEAQKREVAIDIWEKIQEVNKSRMGAMDI